MQNEAEIVCASEGRRDVFLQLLLPEMLWRVASLVVDVYVAALDIWQRLELHLKLLGDVVSFFEGVVLVHHYVDFDNEAWSRVPSADSIEGSNVLRVRHGYVSVSPCRTTKLEGSHLQM